MQKIINGKKYNTKTAGFVDVNSNDLGRGDFRWFSEELYLKKTGEFFLYGEGGGLSRYHTNNGDGTHTEGCKIIPLTIEEAKAWVEENCHTYMYEELFGEAKE